MANTNDQIDRGYRDIRWWAGGATRIPLRTLDPGGSGLVFSGLRRQLAMRTGARTKEYRFMTYDNDRHVRHVVCDIDWHVGVDDTPDDIAGKKALHDQQLRILAGLPHAKIFCLSPGRLIDGVRYQGTYVAFKLDRPVKVADLTCKLIPAWKDYHGYESETCWDSEHRLLRLPGQSLMNLVLLDPASCERTIISPPDETAAGLFNQVAQAWEELEPVSFQDFFGEPLRWQQEQAHSQKRRSGSATRQGRATRQSTRQPALKEKLNDKSNDKSKNNRRDLRFTGEEIERFRQAHNTFDVLVRASQSNAAHLLTVKHQADWDRFDQAVNEYVCVINQLRPETSYTRCCAAKSFACKKLAWFFKHYDPSMTRRQRPEKDQADADRFSYMRDVAEEDILRLIRRRFDMTASEEACWRQLLASMYTYNGRISIKRLYVHDPETGIAPIFTGYRQFTRFRHRFWPIWNVIDRYDQAEHVCNQIAIPKQVIDEIVSLQRVRERYEEWAARADMERCVDTLLSGNVDHHPLRSQPWPDDTEVAVTCSELPIRRILRPIQALGPRSA